MTDTATDQTDLYRDALAAIRDALTLPEAAFGHEHQQARLLGVRARWVAHASQELLAYQNHPHLAGEAVALLRERTARMPAAYPTYVVGNHPDDCAVCGPGCCAPVLAVHASHPGTLVGVTVASVR